MGFLEGGELGEEVGADAADAWRFLLEGLWVGYVCVFDLDEYILRI